RRGAGNSGYFRRRARAVILGDRRRLVVSLRTPTIVAMKFGRGQEARKMLGFADSPPAYDRTVSTSSKMHQAPLMRDGYGLGAADGIELGEDGFDVGLGRAFGNVQTTRDVLVAPALSQLLQHIELTLCEAR